MMAKTSLSRLRPYGVALMAVAIASVLRLLLEYLLEGSAPLLSFILAVMFSAWHGGLGPGLFATALSILVSAYLFFEPFSAPVFNSITNRTRFVLFSVMGVFISVLCGSLLRAKERAERDALRAREGEEQFRTMANTIPQLAWMAHADGFTFWHNRRWHEYTGTTPEQMEGWGWQSVHDPDVLPQVLERWRSAIATGQPFDMEFPLRGADGRFRIFLTRVQPLKDSQGRVVRWFGANTDVDELKGIEEALRETQERLKSTLAAGSIGTWSWDITNDRLVTDEFIARTFSVEADAAAKGMPLEEYIRALPEEERPRMLDAFTRALQSCGQLEIEYRVRLKNGDVCWLQGRGRVERDAEGNALRFDGAALDVTARKLAELKRREAEKMLATALRTSREGFVLLRLRDEMILDVNDGWLNITGYKREDVTGKTTAELNVWGKPEDQERFAATMREHGGVQDFEFAYRHKSGELREASLSAEVVQPRDEPCALIIGRDITERKRAENELRRSQQLLEAIVDNSPAFIYVKDLDGRFVLVNHGLTKLFRRPKADLIGKTTHDLMPWEDADRHRANDIEVIASGRPLAREERNPEADGAHTYYSVKFPLLGGDGKPFALCGISTDITEQKRAEEKLRETTALRNAILDSTTYAIIASDTEGHIHTFNKAAELMLGYKAEEMLGRTPEHLHEPEEMARRAWELSMETGWEVEPGMDVFLMWPRLTGRHEEQSWTYIRKDGSRFPVQLSVGPLLNSENQTIGYVGIASDITERKQADEQLIKSREQLRALTAHLQAVREEERTRISREVHDVLGQLLTALKMDISMFARKLSDYESEDGRAKLAQRIDSMKELADEVIRAVQHISAELRPGVLDTLGLVAAVEWQARDFETRTDIACVCGLPLASIEVSPEKATAMFRIFQEILTNVARHSRATRVNINLWRENGEVVLSVRDNGRGITEEELRDPAALGLLGMSERARLFGGDVKITGARGEGTEVEARLPLHNGAE